MDQLGGRTSYLTVGLGIPVFSSSGTELGRLAHVLAVPEQDLFEGLILKTHHGARFVDATLVDALYERGVVLRPGVDSADELPEPSDNPAQVEVDPDDTVPDNLHDKLRRAWDMLSGRS